MKSLILLVNVTVRFDERFVISFGVIRTACPDFEIFLKIKQNSI